MEMTEFGSSGAGGEIGSMPYSVVFHCRAEDEIDGHAVKGKGLRELILRIFDRVDSEAAQKIVGAKEAPFTVSPFFAKRVRPNPASKHDGQDQRVRGDLIKSGTICRFRLTLLEDRLYRAVTGLVADLPLAFPVAGGALTLNHGAWSGQGADAWPRSQTYGQLSADASPTSKELRLQFVTPTTFQRKGGVLPLPHPQIVFKGFLRSWNWFAFLPLSSDVENLIDRHIFLREFRISPVDYDTGEGAKPAFTGWCRFVLAGRHHEKHIREFNLLADYSFYCGSGHYRDRGMGVTRRL
jgi:CRISPR-associated endoribonuclease Cas6